MNQMISALPVQALLFLLAAVVAPWLFRRLGLGAIVGYLAAGVVLGPSTLGVFKDPEQVLHVAEPGVVLLLFLIGLELNPARFFNMRRDIVLLGSGQLVATTMALGLIAWGLGLPPTAALTVGFALALSSTALAIGLLNEAGNLTAPHGQRTFAVLLAQDMAIVPALALIPAITNLADGAIASPSVIGLKVGAAIGVFAAIVLAGRFLIDPLLRALARSGGRESMIAAALLLVAGAALAAHMVGVSMALGAFLAGLLLSKSSYRHELEADVEPFRGLLLALFFMGVGMSIDIKDAAHAAALLGAGVVGMLVIKLVVAAALARLSGSSTHDAVRVGALLAPGSEFAFVFLPLAASEGLIKASIANTLVALGALSMMGGPLMIAGLRKLSRRLQPPQRKPELEEDFSGPKGSVLVIGFGRFAHIAAQLLHAEGVETTLIDNNAERIKLGENFGFKIYYGDCTRPHVLHAAGAGDARIVLICVEDPDTSLRIVELVQEQFPLAKVYARAYDRAHAIALMDKEVDFQIRETYESAIIFGRTALEALDLPPERVAEVEADVRRRDAERMERQRAEGLLAGMDILHQKTMRPEPLSRDGEAPPSLRV